MQKQPDVIDKKALIAAIKKDPVFQKAMEYAKEAYKKDRRAYTGIDYFSHPMTVTSLLGKFDASSHALVLAALEEVVSRGKRTVAQVRAEFGDAVASDVAVLTAPQDTSQTALEGYRDRLAAASADVQLVKLASMLDHIVAIPSNKLKHAAGAFLADFKVILPGLAKGDQDLFSRVQGALRRASA
ncbi:HD domain-containing protein [Comamonas thiooxydans]|uniref:HD domain-containing protein n=1 Tax=Comamonas thiooxydans TaxID=363952 RepID=UPI001557CE30|nr:HD domain-containing protein [Comamonas thiooxydans]